LEKLGSNFQIYTVDQLFDLLTTRNHPSYIKRHRSLLHIERIRFFSILFSILLPLWLLLDFLIFAGETFTRLAYIKTVAAVVFILLAWPKKNTDSQLASRFLLTVFLFAFPIIFLTSSYYLAKTVEANQNQLMIQLYAMLPYMSVAGLGLFPLTMLEALAYAVPLSAIAISGWLYFINFPILQILPSIWLLLIMIGLAVVSAAMQLQDMISLVSRPSYDPVTSTLSRRSGIDSMVREFSMAILHDNPFSITLIELGELDTIANEYDSHTYDRIVLEAADILGEDLRSNDTLIRWSDKAFLIMLPKTNCTGVKVTIERMRKIGIGTLPDGQPMTACIGVAERMLDEITDWHALIELVEQRLSHAKRLGRDHTVYCGEKIPSS
jgi:diguanylate cyclase (GGDEF)-like protein